MSGTALILSELKKLNARLDAIAPSVDLVLTREQAARQLKVSVRQLQRLVAAGRLAVLPSGVARAELERYARTPHAPLVAAVTRPMRERNAEEEAQRLEQMLKTRRKRR